jgi:hypothetical protein
MEIDICPEWWPFPWPPPWERVRPGERVEKIEIPADGRIALDMFKSLTILAISHTMTGDDAASIRRQAVGALKGQVAELSKVREAGSG